MSFYRHERPGIEALRTAKLLIKAYYRQSFMETPKAYEIWEWDSALGFVGPVYWKRVKRIPKSRVLLVHIKDGWGWCPACQKDVQVDGGLDAGGIYDTCQNCGENINL